MPLLPIVHAPDYDANFDPGHRFPMGKYTRLMELIRDSDTGSRAEFHAPAPAAAEWLALAHNRSYVDQVIASRVPIAIEREIGFAVDERVSRRAGLATAGTVMAASLALSRGSSPATPPVAVITHAGIRVQGFAPSTTLLSRRLCCLPMARPGRILVVDLDVHQGDGTAEICASNASDPHCVGPWRKELSGAQADLGH
jgi:acetoin utilization deacetylase AcuC-like enzyme